MTQHDSRVTDESTAAVADRQGYNAMCIDKFLFRFAGAVIVFSVLLGAFASPYFYWITLLAGANLLQSSYTGFCPVAAVLRKMGMKSCAAF